MATKNFEVLDGLEVSGNAAFDGDTLFVDTTNGRVGVQNSTPSTALEVTGTLTATDFSGNGHNITTIQQNNVVDLAQDFLHSTVSDNYGNSSATVTLALVHNSILRATAGKVVINEGQRLDFGQTTANTQLTYVAASDKLNFNGSNVVFSNSTGGDTLFLDTLNKVAAVNAVPNSTYVLSLAGDQYTTGNILATGDVTAYASDERLKTNLRPIESPLEKLNQINPYLFEWDEEKCQEVGFVPHHKEEHGVLAQDVEKVLPDSVAPAAFDQDYLTVKYDRLVTLLIAAVQELQQEIGELKKQVK